MPPPHPPVAVAVVVLLAACTPAPGPPERAGLPGQGQHAVSGPGGTTAAGSDLRPRPAAASSSPAVTVGDDRSQPAEVAAAAVIDLIEAQDLSVLALATDLRDSTGGQTQVLVSVLHGTGRSHPHQSRYQIQLQRSGGGWVVAGVAAGP